MTASIHPLTPRTRADTLPDDMVNVTAEFFVDEGYQPEDIPLIARSSRARAQVMGAMRRMARAS